ncbi:MAG: hypothetical protein J2P34_03585 [Actinobacteria bacterium]|nr:hypothetical protein [Actinomycetota bacterium]
MSICTDAFRVTAEAMAQAYGFPGFAFVTTAHPIASLSGEEIRARARAVLPDVLGILGVQA